MMPNEGFLQRWSRLKAAPETATPAPAALEALPAAATQAGHALPPAVAPATETTSAPAAALPTLADAAMLNADSDYSVFVARGVDADVRRLAMKKLFADPHFNLIDGLDIYMGDYNVASPVSPAMLASLTHARSVFARIDELLEPAAVGEAAPAIATATPVTDKPDKPDNTGTIDTPAPTPMAPPPDQETA